MVIGLARIQYSASDLDYLTVITQPHEKGELGTQSTDRERTWNRQPAIATIASQLSDHDTRADSVLEKKTIDTVRHWLLYAFGENIIDTQVTMRCPSQECQTEASPSTSLDSRGDIGRRCRTERKPGGGSDCRGR